ncbi:MAG: nuclear transport factor 2 family protein [Haloferacaceae archaeon]
MNAEEDVELARAYYDALDDGAYDRLADLLAPEFVHRRPDRTLVGRESFVTFVRDGRPRTDTTHAIDGLYRRHDAPAGSVEVAVRGRLRAGSPDDETAAEGEDVTGADGAESGDATLFGFVDVFTVEAGRLVELRTYTD